MEFGECPWKVLRYKYDLDHRVNAEGGSTFESKYYEDLMSLSARSTISDSLPKTDSHSQALGLTFAPSSIKTVVQF